SPRRLAPPRAPEDDLPRARWRRARPRGAGDSETPCPTKRGVSRHRVARRGASRGRALRTRRALPPRNRSRRWPEAKVAAWATSLPEPRRAGELDSWLSARYGGFTPRSPELVKIASVSSA